MIDKLSYKIDGLKADFEKEEQIAVVQYLDQKLTEWKTTANTFRQAIDMLYMANEKKK